MLPSSKREGRWAWVFASLVAFVDQFQSGKWKNSNRGSPPAPLPRRRHGELPGRCQPAHRILCPRRRQRLRQRERTPRPAPFDPDHCRPSPRQSRQSFPGSFNKTARPRPEMMIQSMIWGTVANIATPMHCRGRLRQSSHQRLFPPAHRPHPFTIPPPRTPNCPREPVAR